MQTRRWCGARPARKKWSESAQTRARPVHHAPSQRSVPGARAPVHDCYIQPRSRFPQSQLATRLASLDLEALGRAGKSKHGFDNLRGTTLPFKVQTTYDPGENSMRHLRYAGLAILLSFVTGQASAQEKLKIGVIVTLSGPAAALGQQV